MLLYGQGHALQGHRCVIGSKHADAFDYRRHVGKKGIVHTGSYLSVTIALNEGGWAWIRAIDCLPVDMDNEYALSQLKEVDEDECSLPRLL